MVQDLDVQELQQCIMIHCVSSRVMMAIWGLVLKQDVSTMELGVVKTSLVNVCKTYILQFHGSRLLVTVIYIIKLWTEYEEKAGKLF